MLLTTWWGLGDFQKLFQIARAIATRIAHAICRVITRAMQIACAIAIQMTCAMCNSIGHATHVIAIKCCLLLVDLVILEC